MPPGRRRRRDEDAEGDDGPDLRAEWAVIWRRQMVVGIVLSVVGFGPMLAVGAVHGRGDPPLAVVVAMLAPMCIAVVAMLLFSLKNWRCPGCRRYMGNRGFGIRFCHHCGARLA